MIRADHATYLVVLAARGDDNAKLVAYPDFARYVPADAEDSIAIAFIQADIPNITYSKELFLLTLDSRISDFAFLSSWLKDNGNLDEAVLILPGGHKHLEIIIKAKNNVRLHSLPKPGLGKK